MRNRRLFKFVAAMVAIIAVTLAIAIPESDAILTTAGKNSLLGVGVHADAQITTWYLGLIGENRHVNDCAMGGPNWAATTAYALNKLIIPTSGNAGNYTYRASAISGTGTSGGSAPTWPQTAGNTVVDNSGANQITWTNVGVNAVYASDLSAVSGDVSHYIAVFGAGASGANLVTTVTTQPDGTDLALGAAATTNVTGAVCTIGPLLAAADTAASHAGWTELGSSNVTNSVRATWSPGAASAGTTSGTSGNYTMSASISTVYVWGVFAISNNTLGGTTGTLMGEQYWNNAPSGPLAATASLTITPTYSMTLN